MITYNLIEPKIDTSLFDIIGERLENVIIFKRPKYIPKFLFKYIKHFFKEEYQLKHQFINSKINNKYEPYLRFIKIMLNKEVVYHVEKIGKECLTLNDALLWYYWIVPNIRMIDVRFN
jgi:hypothetical protein